MPPPRLTMTALQAMRNALNVALAGNGFYRGGDFEDEDQADYEQARAWVVSALNRRTRAYNRPAPGRIRCTDPTCLHADGESSHWHDGRVGADEFAANRIPRIPP